MIRKDWKQLLEAEAEKRHVSKQKFQVISVFNKGPSLHVTTALGSDRISWWPNSKKRTLYISRINGQRFISYNINDEVAFFNYALSFPPCP